MRKGDYGFTNKRIQNGIRRFETIEFNYYSKNSDSFDCFDTEYVPINKYYSYRTLEDLIDVQL